MEMPGKKFNHHSGKCYHSYSLSITYLVLFIIYNSFRNFISYIHTSKIKNMLESNSVKDAKTSSNFQTSERHVIEYSWNVGYLP